METTVRQSDAWKARFEGERVISLKTYRRNGEQVPTPVWFLEENGVLYVHTSGKSGKAKRLRRNQSVRIAPCEFGGTPKADYVDARAEIITDPETVEKYYTRIYKKYGLQGKLTKLLQRLNRFFTRSNGHKIILRIHS